MTKMLITAGPTREYIDPVRYLSNASSGKMGYALASAGIKLGCDVTLISGPVSLEVPKDVKLIPVETAREMQIACFKHFKSADVIIMSAAVCDYRPLVKSKNKIKKNGKNFNLKLVQNPDILTSLGKKKGKDQTLVGFSLETNDLIKNANKKLFSKKCDFIIANMSKAVGSNYNKVWLLSKNGDVVNIPKMSKDDLSMVILSYILK